MSPAPPLRSLISRATGTQNGYGESEIRTASFLPQAITIRRSVSDYSPSSAGYFNSIPNASASRLPKATFAPPTYDDTLQENPFPPSRFKIQPREEEGNEKLPAYTCSLHREAVFHHKMELSTPFHRAGRRRWGKVYAILHGTLLQLYKPEHLFFLPSCKKQQQQAGKPFGYVPGELLKSYTLQLAEVGIAADYGRRDFVIRLRAQTEQFLLSCRTLETFLDWLEALSAAVDLSPSLEERSLPRYQTIPRRRRRRTPANRIVQEQEAIIHRNFPNLGQASQRHLTATVPAQINRDDNSSSDPLQIAGESSRRASLEQESICQHDLRNPQLEITPSPPSISRARPLQHRFRRPQPQLRETNCFSESGKWAPPVRIITREANMRYARQCMAILCGDTPRQSDYIIMDGKRFKVLWETKQLVLEERVLLEAAPPLPPAYQEVVRSEFSGKNGLKSTNSTRSKKSTKTSS